MSKRKVKDNIKIKDNVTVDVIDVEVVARYLKLSITDAEKHIKSGFNPSFIPGAVTRQSTHNIITNVGLDLTVLRLKDLDNTTAKLTHFAVGTSAATPTITNTTLIAEVYRDIITQHTYASTGVITLKCYIPTAYPATQPVTLRESGLFTAATGGILFARVLFSPEVNKTNTIAMIISWEVHAT